jgi:hypothetical protein
MRYNFIAHKCTYCYPLEEAMKKELFNIFIITGVMIACAGCVMQRVETTLYLMEWSKAVH